MTHRASPCVVTIHGMGLEQPPSEHPRRAGYADALHTNLRSALVAAGLPKLLGDDPNRRAGPVYVTSAVHGSREAGLCRLEEPMVKKRGAEVAHAALVYSPSEPPVLRLGRWPTLWPERCSVTAPRHHEVEALGALFSHLSTTSRHTSPGTTSVNACERLWKRRCSVSFVAKT
jgi:hypothetical protein